MPATFYARASYLMGAFLAGLTFCSSDGLHHIFVRQFKRVLQWLMRIFFAASIGFQVPIKDFGDPTVIWQGLVFTLALIGKIVVGFMGKSCVNGYDLCCVDLSAITFLTDILFYFFDLNLVIKSPISLSIDVSLVIISEIV